MSVFRLAGVASLAACLSFACQKGADPRDDEAKLYTESDIADQVTSGKVKGSAWVFRSGRADTSFAKETEMQIELWDTLFTEPCNWFTTGSGGAREAQFDAPFTPGAYQLSFDRDVTLFGGDGFMDLVWAEEGIVVIDSVTADSVFGRLTAVYDANNTISGRFAVPFCR